MSTAELIEIERRGQEYCSGNDGTARGATRSYIESTAAPSAVSEFFVDPRTGLDSPTRSDGMPNGRARDRAFRTLTYALGQVPTISTSSTDHKYIINLVSDRDFYWSDEEAVVPRPDGLGHSDGTLAIRQRAGRNATHPIIIKAEGSDTDYFDDTGNLRSPDRRPRLHFRLNLFSPQYFYIKNIRIIIVDGTNPSTHRPEDGTTDPRAVLTGVVSPLQCATSGALPAHHVLLRGCELDGGWRQSMPRALISEEVLKVNQCQHMYVERCQIHGAYGDGKNAVDFVAVQYGHIIDSDIYDSAGNWCAYVKGGSAHLRIEGNRIHDGAQGFSIGEGTTSVYLREPWWHYEAYAIQFVNNLVYNTLGGGTGVGVQGGYGILIAHNTLYNVGTNSQMISMGFGERDCDGTPAAECQRLIDSGAWATTHRSTPIIPNHRVYIYNNILLVDNGMRGFNVFDIARTPSSPPSGTGFPTNLPSPYAADRDLLVEGNFLGIAGVTGTPDFMSWFDSTFVSAAADPRSPSFRSDFMSRNRTDVMPQLNTDVRDPSRFLRPGNNASNVLERDTAISQVRELPNPPDSATWTGDLSPLLPRGTPAPPAPWPEAHRVSHDFDRFCRGVPPVQGARTRPSDTDFYVRDWTRDSNHHDMGQEPSTQPDFFTTSDVWNQRDSSSPRYTPGGQPDNQVPQMGTGPDPNNYMLARITRNVTGTSARVRAEFLFSEFGVGSRFVSIGTSFVNFTPTQPDAVAVLPWRLGPTTSTHCCLAVQIRTVDASDVADAVDPYIGPSLDGLSPGHPTDTMLRNDNNKAQRNIFSSPVPMGSMSGSGEIEGGSGTTMSLYALVQNAATFSRDMELLLELSDDAQLDWWRSTRLEVISGHGVEVKSDGKQVFKPGSTLTLQEMRPGENRWIGLTVEVPASEHAKLPLILFYEMEEGTPINGFALGLQPATMSEVIEANLLLHEAVFWRMALMAEVEGAKDQGARATELRGQKLVTSEEYLNFLMAADGSLEAAVQNLSERLEGKLGDVFRILDSLRELEEFVKVGDTPRASVAHASLLNKLDAFLTMLQKA